MNQVVLLLSFLCTPDCPGSMAQQALHDAQARLDKLETPYDKASSALEADPSSDLKRECDKSAS